MQIKLFTVIEKKLTRYCIIIMQTNKRYCFNSKLERDGFIKNYERNEQKTSESYVQEQAKSMATEDWTITQEGTELVFRYKGKFKESKQP